MSNQKSNIPRKLLSIVEVSVLKFIVEVSGAVFRSVEFSTAVVGRAVVVKSFVDKKTPKADEISDKRSIFDEKESART